MMKRTVEESRSLLNLLEPEILTGAVLLYDEPLYQYTNDRREIHVLFVGPDPMDENLDEWKMMNSILQLSLSCGQVLNHTLHLHVTAKNAAAYKEKLLQIAPALRQFTCIDGESVCENPLAYLTFEDVKGINSSAGNKKLFAYLETCSYVITALKDKNGVLVETLYKKLCSMERKSIIVYTGEKFIPENSDKNVKLYCLKERTSKADRTVEKLGRMAFKQHYYYCRQGNPYVSMEKEREAFQNSDYNQMANLSSVIHIRYKLWSVGINPKGNATTIIKQYGKILVPNAPEFDQLSYLEHSRWMLEKILDGYRSVESVQELEEYCFVNGNNRWFSKKEKFHNCLKLRKLRKESNLAELPPDQWKLTGTDLETRINLLPYDDLDKMSLLVHNLAHDKIQIVRKQLTKDIEIFGEKARRQVNVDQFFNPLPRFDEWLNLAVNNTELRQTDLWIDELQQYCRNVMLPQEVLQPVLDNLNTLIVLVREYYRFKDYKDLDDDVVLLLPELYCKPDNVSLIKLPSAYIVNQVASPLLIEPQKVIYAGMEKKQTTILKQFFQDRGGFAEIMTIANSEERQVQKQTEVTAETVSEECAAEEQLVQETERTEVVTVPVPRERLIQSLKQTIRKESENGLCIIDVTGAEAGLVIEISDYAKTLKNTALITCDSKTQQIQNLYQYPLAACIIPRVQLTVEEVFFLMGTKKKGKGCEYDGLFVKEKIDRIWSFYLNHAEKMDQIGSMIHTAGALTKENGCDVLYFEKKRLTNQTKEIEWTEETQNGSAAIFEYLELEKVLWDLEKHGIVKGVRIEKNSQTQTVWYSYQIPRFFSFARLWLSVDRTRPVFKPMECICTELDPNTVHLRWKSEKDKELYVSAEGVLDSNNTLIFIKTDKNKNEKMIKLPVDVWNEVLKELQALGLIYAVDCHVKNPKDLQKKVKTTFFFCETAIINLFATKGNILELKAWSEFINTDYFDDVKSNFQFWWDQEQGTENELDILAVRGMELVVVSCKFPLPEKAHLYEVYCLANRFSMNSRAAMVYSFDPKNPKEYSKEKPKENWKTVWNRAERMHVAVANVLDEKYSLEAMLNQLVKKDNC